MSISDYLFLTGACIVVISSLFAAMTGFRNTMDPSHDETPLLTFLGGVIVFGYLAAVGWAVYGTIALVRWLL